MPMVNMRVLAEELCQLALWIELLSRQEGGASPGQRELVAKRVAACLQRLTNL